jgi:hypothetical protein
LPEGFIGKHTHAAVLLHGFYTISMLQLKLFETVDTQKITLDLFYAYFNARKNKRNTINALAFEKHFENNIFKLCDEIISYQYTQHLL